MHFCFELVCVYVRNTNSAFDYYYYFNNNNSGHPASFSLDMHAYIVDFPTHRLQFQFAPRYCTHLLQHCQRVQNRHTSSTIQLIRQRPYLCVLIRHNPETFSQQYSKYLSQHSKNGTLTRRLLKRITSDTNITHIGNHITDINMQNCWPQMDLEHVSMDVNAIAVFDDAINLTLAERQISKLIYCLVMCAKNASTAPVCAKFLQN
jgi:hypothetical protein